MKAWLLFNFIFCLCVATSVVQANAPQVLLNAPLQSSSDISSYKLSPDGSRAVYRGDQDTPGRNELYSVNLDGTARVKLNPVLNSGEEVADGYQITADGARVVFLVSASPDRLYSVPLAGGTATQLDISNLAEGPLHGTQSFQVSADSSKVVFVADLVTRSSRELFSVSIAGGTPIQLAPDFPGPAPFGSPAYLVSPDSAYVVFRAKLSFSGEFQLFSVPIGGGDYVRLNDNLAANGEIENFSGFYISADSARVIYLAEQDSPGVQELYSAPITGGGSSKLNDVLAAGRDVVNYVISPDGQTVVYQARLSGSSISHHYAVPISGGSSTQLSADVVAGGGYVIGGPKGPQAPFFITPDSARMVYRGKVEDADKWELYSVPMSGGASTKISRSLVSGGNVSASTDPDNAYFRGYQQSPDGSQVLYFADAEVDEELNLYSVPSHGGASIRLTPSALLSSIPPKLTLSPDSKNAVYFSDVDLDDRIEAHGVRLDGMPVAQNLINQDVSSFLTTFVFTIRQIVADFNQPSTHLVFIDKQASNPDALQLFASDEMDDQDADGVFDFTDNCIAAVNTDQANFDNDPLGDVCDPDDDNDNVNDGDDAFPFDSSESRDADGDRIGDNADPNDDNDLHLDENDNCQFVANDQQLDTDADAAGDACDADDDNDGVDDAEDVSSLDPTACRDFDVDSCDDCSIGMDGFGPLVDFNVSNDGLDTDQDGQCNVGDTDDDNDTVNDEVDNCPLVANMDQADNNNYLDGEGEGDACEDTDMCVPVAALNGHLAIICL